MELNGINSVTNSVAIREKIYNAALRSLLEPELMAQNFVDMVQGFTDGEIFTDIEIGNAAVRDYEEGNDIVLEGLDMGSREFRINRYKQSGHYITEKFTQDSFVSAKIASVVPGKEARAIAAHIEQDILDQMNKLAIATAVEGIAHRWVSGYDAASQTTVSGSLTISDFAMAATALHKCNYFGPMVAIIPAFMEYAITQNPSFQGALNHQPMYEKIVRDGALSGTRFAFNIFGFDVYVSNFTPVIASETANDLAGVSKTATNCGVALFFANIPDYRPVRMAWRMMPKFEGAWNMYKRREEFVTICRYGLGEGEANNVCAVIVKQDPTSTIQ